MPRCDGRPDGPDTRRAGVHTRQTRNSTSSVPHAACKAPDSVVSATDTDTTELKSSLPAICANGSDDNDNGVCPGCRTHFEKLQTRLNDLLTAHSKLAAEVVELRNTINSIAHSAPGNTASLSHCPSVATVEDSPSNGPASRRVLVSVHAELSDARRRKRNVVVSGMPSIEGTDDCDVFSRICEENLAVKPAVVQDKCRRIGKEREGKPRLFLAALRSEESASNLLRAARQLRRSSDDNVRHHVFINADLTRAEAQLAFERREARRRQLLRQSPAPTSSNFSAASLSAPSAVLSSSSSSSSMPMSLPVIKATATDISHVAVGNVSTRTDVASCPGLNPNVPPFLADSFHSLINSEPAEVSVKDSNATGNVSDIK